MNAAEHLLAPLGLGGNEEGLWEKVSRGEILLCCCNAQMLVRFQSGMGSHICKGILEHKVRMFCYQKVICKRTTFSQLAALAHI